MATRNQQSQELAKALKAIEAVDVLPPYVTPPTEPEAAVAPFTEAQETRIKELFEEVLREKLSIYLETRRGSWGDSPSVSVSLKFDDQEFSSSKDSIITD